MTCPYDSNSQIPETSEDQTVYNEISEAARTILKYVSEPDDVVQINRWLAELEPYPSNIIQLTEVK